MAAGSHLGGSGKRGGGWLTRLTCGAGSRGGAAGEPPPGGRPGRTHPSGGGGGGPQTTSGVARSARIPGPGRASVRPGSERPSGSEGQGRALRCVEKSAGVAGAWLEAPKRARPGVSVCC